MGSLTKKISIITKLKNFFMEFNFSGITSIRFYNTLYHQAQKGTAQAYVLNYFKLIDSPYVDEVKKKLGSQEFKLLITELKACSDNAPKINNRLEIYYGEQGGGKTTTAIENYPNAEVLPCNSSFEPNDLFEVFSFEGGSPVYKPSPLMLAMKLGKPVILDEINLLTRDNLRAIQGFLDNKSFIMYKDQKIEIKEGFKIIGTMNLEVNGQIEELPAPLVDRASELIEFIPCDETIAKLSLGK